MRSLRQKQAGGGCERQTGGLKIIYGEINESAKVRVAKKSNRFFPSVWTSKNVFYENPYGVRGAVKPTNSEQTPTDKYVQIG